MASKFKINHNAFSSFSKDAAYWAGFIAADGNVRVTSHGCKQIRIYLKKSDAFHLEKFKEFLRSDHKISLSPTYDRCSFEFTSDQIYEDLVKFYNITPRKSLTYLAPELPADMWPHFIRGVFDGDGCITEGFWNKNSKTASVSVTIVGTANLIERIYTWAELKIGTILYKPSNHHSTPGCRIFNLCIRQAMVFLSELYVDSTENTRLDRKYIMYSRIVSGGRRTRNIVPYDQRMPCKTNRKRRPYINNAGPAPLLKPRTRHRVILSG